MVEISDEEKEARRDLRSLQKGIDIGNKVVRTTHDFQEKLHDAQGVTYHLLARCSHNQDVKELLEKIVREFTNLIEILQVERKGFLHIVTEEKAILKFRKETRYDERGQWLEKKLVEEKEADALILTICQEHFQRLKELFEGGEKLFSIDIEKTKIKKVKVDLGEEKKMFIKYMSGLLQYILIYEKILKEL